MINWEIRLPAGFKFMEKGPQELRVEFGIAGAEFAQGSGGVFPPWEDFIPLCHNGSTSLSKTLRSEAGKLLLFNFKLDFLCFDVPMCRVSSYVCD